MTPLIRCPICHASWPKGSIQQCSHTDEEWRKYNNELSVPEGNQRATEKKIRAAVGQAWDSISPKLGWQEARKEGIRVIKIKVTEEK